MNTLSNLDLNLAAQSGWLILLLLLFIGFSIFIYRWTNPPVNNKLRYGLIILRIFALATLLFIIFEPVLSLTWQRLQKPIIAVLVDNSASMQLTDATGPRKATVQQILRQPFLKELTKKNELAYFHFANSLEAWPAAPEDSLNFDGDGTDIQKALQLLNEKMADRYLKSIILITDGADNLGENPNRLAANLGLPIFPIAVGDPSEPKDVLITRTFTNQITYVNNKVPLEVTIKSTGCDNERIQVLLKNEGRVLETQQVRLSGTALEQKLEFQFTPQAEGITKYQVEIPPLPGEITTLNNQQDFYVKVLKSRMKILIIAGAPSPDFAFLKQNLSTDANVEIETFVEKNAGNFYEGAFPAATALKKYDAIVLVDFPRRTSAKNVVFNLTEAIRNQEIPLLFIAGQSVDYRQLIALNGLFPINLSISAQKEREIQLSLTAEGSNHPIFRIKPDIAENVKLWHDLPPIYSPYLNLRPNPVATVMVEIDKSRSSLPQSLPQQPVIALTQIGTQKIVAIMAYGLWRWDFVLIGLGKENIVYQTLFHKMIRWLVTREESKRVRIQVPKEIFRGGEPVTFKGEVYFEDYQPMNDAEVKVILKNDSLEQELLLNSKGNGKYETTLQMLAGGDYQFIGQAVREGQVVGADSGKFSVEPFSLEFQSTRMEEEILQKMAAVTGGKYFTAADYSNLPDHIDFPPKRSIESREWELWNKLALLLAILLFLTSEWFIRKKKGML